MRGRDALSVIVYVVPAANSGACNVPVRATAGPPMSSIETTGQPAAGVAVDTHPVKSAGRNVTLLSGRKGAGSSAMLVSAQDGGTSLDRWTLFRINLGQLSADCWCVLRMERRVSDSCIRASPARGLMLLAL